MARMQLGPIYGTWEPEGEIPPGDPTLDPQDLHVRQFTDQQKRITCEKQKREYAISGKKCDIKDIGLIIKILGQKADSSNKKTARWLV